MSKLNKSNESSVHLLSAQGNRQTVAETEILNL